MLVGASVLLFTELAGKVLVINALGTALCRAADKNNPYCSAIGK